MVFIELLAGQIPSMATKHSLWKYLTYDRHSKNDSLIFQHQQLFQFLQVHQWSP
jgi:hypothetical protein